MPNKQYGVFTKDGFGRRIAYSPAEAVQYTYDGWTRIADRIGPAPSPDRKTAASSTSSSTDADTAPKKATSTSK